MTGYRPPIVAGVSGGVGTTTVALALHGRDVGTDTAAADVLVCRSSVESLDRATRIADLTWPGRYPVLLVTLDGAERRPPARLARLHDRWQAVVPVPHIPQWRELVDPYREAAGLLGSPRAELPRPVRALLDAISRAARVVADSGRLSGPPLAQPPGWAAAEPHRSVGDHGAVPTGADWRDWRAARPIATAQYRTEATGPPPRYARAQPAGALPVGGPPPADTGHDSAGFDAVGAGTRRVGAGSRIAGTGTAGPGGAEPGGAVLGGAELGGVVLGAELGGAELGGPEHGGPEHGGAEHGGPEHGGPEHGRPELGGPELGGPVLGGPDFRGPELRGDGAGPVGDAVDATRGLAAEIRAGELGDLADGRSIAEAEPLRLIHSPVESTVDSTGCGEPAARLPELRPVRGIRVLDAGGVAG